jgi:hypothetical protein
MKLSIVAVLAFAAAVMANPMDNLEKKRASTSMEWPGPLSRRPHANGLAVFKRQQQAPPAGAVRSGPAVNEPSMTDRQGNVIAFDPNNLYLPFKEAGI